MKIFTAIALFTLSIILPTFAFANGCGLTKALYDSKEFVQAFKTAKVHASYGDACSEYYLGVMYYRGYGTRPNNKLAVKYLNRAARQGYKPAKTYLNNRGG